MRTVRSLVRNFIVVAVLSGLAMLLLGSTASAATPQSPQSLVSVANMASLVLPTMDPDSVSKCNDSEVVKAGQVLSIMSAAHNRKGQWLAVAAQNDIKDANVIQPKQKICFHWSGKAPSVAPSVKLTADTTPMPASKPVAHAAPAPKPAPKPVPKPASKSAGTCHVPVSAWDRVAQDESGGVWTINTGNGYYGGLQFSHDTWKLFGGNQFAPEANQASKAEQIIVANKTLLKQGWNAWPNTSRTSGVAKAYPVSQYC